MCSASRVGRAAGIEGGSYDTHSMLRYAPGFLFFYRFFLNFSKADLGLLWGNMTFHGFTHCLVHKLLYLITYNLVTTATDFNKIGWSNKLWVSRFSTQCFFIVKLLKNVSWSIVTQRHEAATFILEKYQHRESTVSRVWVIVFRQNGCLKLNNIGIWGRV